MTASQIGDGNVDAWVTSYLNGTHRTVLHTAAWMILCLVVAQRLKLAALVRSLPAAEPGSARSRLRRVKRGWDGPAVPHDTLPPRLIRAARTVRPVGVAGDTSRLVPGGIWPAGLGFAGPTWSVGWVAIPYPWPAGCFQATPLSVGDHVAAAFPSALLFARWLEREVGWTGGLRRSDWGAVAGVSATVRDHWEAVCLRPGERVPARSGRGRREQPCAEVWIVINALSPRPPRPKPNPSTQRERAVRARAPAKPVAQKGRKSTPPSARAQKYAQTGGLFTTASAVNEAVPPDAARMAIEETFRDWPQGWGLREAAAALTQETATARMIGIVCLGYHLQVDLGVRFSADPKGPARRAQGTVTNRGSFFWCAQQLVTDPGANWGTWLADQWEHLITPDAEITLQEAA